MEHNLPAYYWQWSSPAASTAGCEDSRFSLRQPRPHSHFQAFQVQTDHRLLCITGRPAHQFSVKGFRRFLQPGVCTQACSIFPATFCWPPSTRTKKGFGCTEGTLRQSLYFLWRKTFAQYREGKAFLMGWAFLRPAESSSSWSPVAHLNIVFLWANPAPGLLFPAHSVSCSLNFCIWKKPKSPLKSHSSLAASAMLLV